MAEIAVYLLSTALLLLLALYFYRQHRNTNTTTIQLTNVSLRVDRKDLLTQKRKAVANRRGTLNSKTKLSAGQPPAATESQPTPPESADDGFGEDLGMALTLAQTIPKRESRFSKLKGAAKELEDAYNQNNTIKP